MYIDIDENSSFVTKPFARATFCLSYIRSCEVNMWLLTMAWPIHALVPSKQLSLLVIQSLTRLGILHFIGDICDYRDGDLMNYLL